MNISGEKDLTDSPCVGICSATALGDDICIARSIGIAACTLVFGIEANKELPESNKKSLLRIYHQC